MQQPSPRPLSQPAALAGPPSISPDPSLQRRVHRGCDRRGSLGTILRAPSRPICDTDRLDPLCPRHLGISFTPARRHWLFYPSSATIPDLDRACLVVAHSCNPAIGQTAPLALLLALFQDAQKRHQDRRRPSFLLDPPRHEGLSRRRRRRQPWRWHGRRERKGQAKDLAGQGSERAGGRSPDPAVRLASSTTHESLRCRPGSTYRRRSTCTT